MDIDNGTAKFIEKADAAGIRDDPSAVLDDDTGPFDRCENPIASRATLINRASGSAICDTPCCFTQGRRIWLQSRPTGGVRLLRVRVILS